MGSTITMLPNGSMGEGSIIEALMMLFIVYLLTLFSYDKLNLYALLNLTVTITISNSKVSQLIS